jgi:intracellular sulfur oxidation DsrE/DsrF family protein
MNSNVVLIGGAGLGSGSAELGGAILANFLRLLGDRDELLEYIVLWNDGVKIAVRDSLWLEHLRKLVERGVKIISCRTCVEYFGLEPSMAIGEIGTMPQIQELLLTNRVLTV